MSVVDSLAAWGILRPAEVVELAAAARLDLACAAVCLEKESGGGRNVWGHDAVATAGTYVKGAEVTRDAYLAYREALREGRAGAQGVGPCQLTYPPLQVEADKLGGCWDWRSNVTVGFRHLAQLQRSYGVRDGFRRYNGSGPAAERYADDAMAKLARWRDRLGQADSTVAAPAVAPREDTVSWTRQDGAPPIPDWYRENLPPLPDPATALAWATAHAAHARDEAHYAAKVAEENQATLAQILQLLSNLAPGSAPTAFEITGTMTPRGMA